MPPKFRRPAGVLGPVAKAAAKAGAAKAKAKAGVKAKARPKRGARDRGRRDRGRDRGGAGDRGAEADVAFNKEDFLKGVEFSAALVPIGEWKKGLRLVLSEASYWEEKLQVAGVLEKVEFDGEAVTAYLSLEGTTGEGLVKWKGKYPGQLLSVHFCPKDCGKVSKDGLAHCEKVRLLKPELEEAWMRNLMGMERPEGEDELEALRMRSGEVGLGGAPPGVKKKKRGSASESEISSGEKRSGRKDKKKKKKKSASSKEKKKKVSGTKSLEAVFGTTGLDPDPTSRKKVLRRAKKLAKKKARRSSSSSESSTSSESSLSGEGGSSVIFGQEVKVKSLWMRVPGALTAATLQQLQTALVQQTGQPWELDRKALPPIFTQYWKAVLDMKASRPMSREMSTLAFILDLLLQGRAAAACDVATQRLKSLEQVAGGGDFRVAQRQELVPLEHHTMSSTTETLEASRLQREELKAKGAASGKGSWDRRGAQGDSEYWEKGRGKKGDYQRGKGKGHKGDGKKGDQKGGQEDKEKK